MSAYTLRDLCKEALFKLNIYSNKSTNINNADIQTCLYNLDVMTNNWSNTRNLIFSIKEYDFNVVPGQKVYTLGPGADWNIPRPMAIEQAYAIWQESTSLQRVDLPIALLNDAQYASISVKNTPSSFAFGLYDDGSYPWRNITLWPIPTVPTQVALWLRQPLIDLTNNSISQLSNLQGGSGYTNGVYSGIALYGGQGSGATANITVAGGSVTVVTLVNPGQDYATYDSLTQYPLFEDTPTSNPPAPLGNGTGFTIQVASTQSALDAPINYPPGYTDAFVYNLALRIADDFKRAPSDYIIARATETKKELMKLNARPQYRSGDGGLSVARLPFNWITGGFVPWTR
jgi:hypothetical protein